MYVKSHDMTITDDAMHIARYWNLNETHQTVMCELCTFSQIRHIIELKVH